MNVVNDRSVVSIVFFKITQFRLSVLKCKVFFTSRYHHLGLLADYHSFNDFSSTDFSFGLFPFDLVSVDFKVI